MDRKKLYKIILSAVLAMGAVLGTTTVVVMNGDSELLDRYVFTGTTMNVDDDIWTQVVDPCDPIYSHVVGPAKTWADQFGMSERSVFAYNIALAKLQRDELRTMITDVNDKCDDIITKQEQILEMIGREVEEVDTQ